MKLYVTLCETYKHIFLGALRCKSRNRWAEGAGPWETLLGLGLEREQVPESCRWGPLGSFSGDIKSQQICLCGELGQLHKKKVPRAKSYIPSNDLPGMSLPEPQVQQGRWDAGGMRRFSSTIQSLSVGRACRGIPKGCSVLLWCVYQSLETRVFCKFDLKPGKVSCCSY